MFATLLYCIVCFMYGVFIQHCGLSFGESILALLFTFVFVPMFREDAVRELTGKHK